MIGKTNALVGGGGPSPSGTINISSNGIYDVGSYASASVNVPQTSTEPTAVELLNGTISYFSDSTITNVKSYAFYNCSNLSQCIISNSAQTIGMFAFYGCSTLTDLSGLSTGNLYSVQDSAFTNCYRLSTNVLMRSTYNFYIGAFAFYGCSSITSVSLYTSVVGNCIIANNAFANCTNLSNIYVSASYVENMIGAFANTAIPFVDDSVNFNPVNNSTGSYIIPSNCFGSCSQLSYVRFQSRQYYYIGTSAFKGCGNLLNVYGGSVITIAGSVFQDCYNLSIVSFPMLQNVWSYAFYNCSSLLSFSCSSTLLNGSCIFWNCRGLKYVNIPSAVTCGSRAFANDYDLKYINVKNAATVSSTAFQNCSSLKSYMVTSTTFRINGSYVFQGCQALESFYLFTTGNIMMSNAYEFNFTPLSDSSYLGYFGSIYVRQSLLSSYQAATNWAAYASRMVGLTDAEVEQIISAYDAVTYEDVIGE